MAEKPIKPASEQPSNLDPASVDLAGKAQLFDELMADPEVRSSTLRHLSKKHPDVYLPEVRIMDEVETRVKKVEDAYKADKEKRESDELQAKLAREKASATKGLDEAGVTALEKLMVDRRIGDYAAARELYDLQHKPARPSGVSSLERAARMPDALKDISANPLKYARTQARLAIDDLNRQREERERN